MTDELLTEDQEAERAKQWLRENGFFIVAGVLIGLGGLFGWQAWKDSRQSQAVEASTAWQQLREAIASEQYNKVDETLAVLENDYANTPYLDQARLAMARMYMDRNDFEGAAQQLLLLEQEGDDPQLQQIALLRRAQILISEERHDEALQLLSPDLFSGMASLQQELRGDAYFAQGDFASAHDAYQLALSADSGTVIDRNFVQMKLDDAAASMRANGSPPQSESDALLELPAIDNADGSD